MATMPEKLRKRQTGGEEARFTWAFNECLRRDPNKAPSPTAINLLLDKPPPLNILTGRKSAIRTRLLIEAGFVQDRKWGRWYRPVRICEKCGGKRLRLEVPPDFESFEVCRDCGHIQEGGREDL